MEDRLTFQPGTGVAPATLVELTVGCRYLRVWQGLALMNLHISSSIALNHACHWKIIV